MKSKNRLDIEMHKRGLCESRSQAAGLVLAGEVCVDGEVIRKCGTLVSADCEIGVKKQRRFVSRGGEKLSGALQDFNIEVAGKIFLDAGASTGGFSDCLLQNGAKKIYAFDVGTNQLAWKIRSNPCVVAREKFNLRYLTKENGEIADKIDLIVVDVSFISITKILARLYEILEIGGKMLLLIKPQFELAQNEVGKGGIVREVELQKKAVESVCNFAQAKLGLKFLGQSPSHLKGTDGNQEYFALLQKVKLL